jgi:hypothetical protein
MKMQPVLYLLMETKARELEGRAFIALEAAKRGFQVVIGHKSPITSGLLSGLLPRGIVFERTLLEAVRQHCENLLILVVIS